MRILETPTKLLSRFGDALAPEDETARKVRAMTALLLLTGAVIAYIILI